MALKLNFSARDLMQVAATITAVRIAAGDVPRDGDGNLEVSKALAATFMDAIDAQNRIEEAAAAVMAHQGGADLSVWEKLFDS